LDTKSLKIKILKIYIRRQKIEEEREELIRKLAEILYHQYLKDLREGRINIDTNLIKIKEKVG